MATRITADDLRARKTPRQPRAQATVDAIIEATARILAAGPHDSFSTNRVAELAGVSIGSLYQYFPDKTALVAALLEREHTALADALDALVNSLDGASLAESIRSVAHFAVMQQFGHGRLAAILDLEEAHLPVETMLAGVEARIVTAVALWIDRHRNTLPRDLPAEAAQDCLAIAKALVEGRIGAATANAADLEVRVARALTGYLTVTSIRNDCDAPGAMPMTPGLSRKSPV